MIVMHGADSGSKRFLLSRALGLAFVLLACSLSLHAQQSFGYVLDVKGEWVLNGAAKLSKGSSLSVGGVITAANPTDSNSYIVIANRSGSIVEKRTCSHAGECSNPIRLPAAVVVQQSLASRLIGAAMALVSNEPAKYSSFISRGADLQEAVIKKRDQNLDLSQVFKNMRDDRYLVRFERISKNARASSRPPKPLPFDWDKKKPAPLAAAELSPGLYRVSILEVSLLEPDGGNEPSGNEAWVLITTPNLYAKAAPSFDTALNLTKQWGTSVKQNAVRQFLRASLEFISKL